MPGPGTDTTEFEAFSVDVRPLRALGISAVAVAALVPRNGLESIPSCPFRSVTGLPCPFCGMTRGFASAVRGDIVHAAWLNPASVVVLATVVLLLVVPRVRRVAIPSWAPAAFLSLVAAAWIFELGKVATGTSL